MLLWVKVPKTVGMEPCGPVEPNQACHIGVAVHRGSEIFQENVVVNS